MKRVDSDDDYSPLSISRLRISGARLPPIRLYGMDRENFCLLIPVRYIRSVTNDMYTSFKTRDVCRSQIMSPKSVLQVQLSLFVLLVLLIAKLHALDEYMLRGNKYVCIFTCKLTYNPCLTL